MRNLFISFLKEKNFMNLFCQSRSNLRGKKGSEAHMYGFYHHCATWSFHFLFASGIHVYTMSVYDPGGHYRQKLPLLTVICVWQRAEAKIFNDVLKRPNFDFDIFGYLYSRALCEHRTDGRTERQCSQLNYEKSRNLTHK